MMILDNFCFRDLSPKGHLGRQEGRFPIDDDTGVILMESTDIQDTIQIIPITGPFRAWKPTILMP